ncbi:MAG: hypothetical protein P4L42_00380 [Desulfocapsaceae bacterium]|nr:hypothetical protein [Desulfocapsaceae bacterium]
MSHTYLLDLYSVLAARKKQIQDTAARTCSPADELSMQGRLDAITDFTAFLKNSYHTRLPRRMQKD